MPIGDERDREIQSAERLARVEEKMTGVRTEVSGLREDFTEFRQEMRGMWGQVTGLMEKMTETYPTKAELQAELQTRDLRIEALEKWREGTKQRNLMRTGWRVALWGALGSAAFSTIVLGVVEIWIALRAHG